MNRTQLFRPTLMEASQEATKSPDSHWTATLGSAGMTRIARTVVQFCWLDAYADGTWESTADEDPSAGHLYESFWR